MNADDVEMQSRIERHDDEGGNDDEDDHCFDGMEVEDWLIKQHAMNGPRDADELQQTMKTNEATLLSDQYIIDDNFANEYQPRTLPASTTTDKNVGNITQLPIRPVAETFTTTETLDPSTVLDAEARTLASYENFFVAEVSSNDDQRGMVIEGVKTMDPKLRRIFTILGVLVVSCLVATGAGFITNLFTSSSRDSILVDGGGDENATMAPISTPIISRGGNLSVTIGDVWYDAFAGGGIEEFIVQNGAFDLFKKVLTQSDKNYTFFLVDKQADAVGGMGISMISKTLSPMYNGHVVSMKMVDPDSFVSVANMCFQSCCSAGWNGGSPCRGHHSL